MDRFLDKSEARTINAISDVYDSLDYSGIPFKLCKPDNEAQTVFGWIELQSDKPDDNYLEFIPKIAAILAENYFNYYPKGFFTLDNNIGDRAFSFKIYLNEV